MLYKYKQKLVFLPLKISIVSAKIVRLQIQNAWDNKSEQNRFPEILTFQNVS